MSRANTRAIAGQDFPEESRELRGPLTRYEQGLHHGDPIVRRSSEGQGCYSKPKSMRGLPGSHRMRNRSEGHKDVSDSAAYREYHRREAARLRSLAAAATTAASKGLLLEEAEKHGRLARHGPGAKSDQP